ncbi:MAG: conjugal transfer protein TraF, partial [Gammaproteobacteria bacterium]|nr:conjugal transfer protein TraF [Gammaproteobacteria bacterium]
MQIKYGTYVWFILVLVSILSLWIPLTPAYSMSFGSFDPRAMAMGGTGVSSGTSANASHYNPALLSIGQRERLSLEIPVFTLRLADPQGLQDAIDTYQAAGYETTLTTATNTFNTSGSIAEFQTNASAMVTALQNLKNGIITTLSNRALIAEANLGVVIAAPGDTFGFSLYSNARSTGGVRLLIDNTDFALLDNFLAEMNNVVLTGIPDLANPIYSGGQLSNAGQTLNSSFDVRGATVVETGLSLSKRFRLFYLPVSIGITPKSVSISTFDYSAGLSTGSYSTSQGNKDYTDSNFDVGIATHLGRGLRFGLVGKNLLAKSYTTIRGNPIEIKPQFRAGISHHTRWSVIAVDADLIKNDPIGFDEPTRFVSAGIEL